MRQIFRDPRFALFELMIIIFCGAIWMIFSSWGIWFILPLFALLLLKAITRSLRFVSLDWLVFIFLATALIGCWAAYDQTIAWNKIGSIAIGVLLYFSLREQPKENLKTVSILLFLIGVCTSVYYFLTYDFIVGPRRLAFVNSIGSWFMSIRPYTGWDAISSNYAVGITAITTPFIFYHLLDDRNSNWRGKIWFYSFAVTGIALACLMLVMATSRGIVLAIGSSVGAWFLWKFTQLNWIRHRFKSEALFQPILLVYLCGVIGLLYLGPARVGGAISDSNFYGTGSRAELFARSLFLVLDYPLIGGGLGSFPGLYSQYLLGIPFYYLPNSHNLFLDVAIEQGLLGGFSFLFIYIAVVWLLAGSIARRDGIRTLKWIVLFALIVAIIQGMVSNYLYNGIGSILSLFLIGLALNGDVSKLVDVNLSVLFVGIVIAIIAVVGILNLDLVRSVWYANLGSVQMTKVELNGFPDNGWIGNEIITELTQADQTLQASLQFDPSNRTANQRLGMIAMYRMDFDAAVNYLETAHLQAPVHRGVIKSLGYSYLWSGNVQNAQRLLTQIPEAEQELSVYEWWWVTRGRGDLSELASLALGNMNVVAPSP